MKLKMKEISILILLSFVFLSTLIISILGIIGGASVGQLGDGNKGIGYFKPFTIDSNIYLGISAMLVLVFYIRKLIRNKRIPKIIQTIYFTSVVSVGLTFITVLFFLFPSAWVKNGFGYAILFYSNDMFFFHLLNPILALLLYLLINDEQTELKECFYAVIPMALYAIVYLCCVVLFKVWKDFYGFTFGGKNTIIPFVIIVMFAVTFGIAFLNSRLCNYFLKTKGKMNEIENKLDA